MSNELVAQTGTTSLSVMSEADLMNVLRNSLYPGAADDSIKLVIGYCKAAGLDPMQKPVHIVPMDVAVKGNGGSISYQKRDVIMPGIGLYRTQASRTNAYAGVTEPEFGAVKKIAVQRKQFNNASRDDKTFTMVPDGEMEFPEWCKVTVKRLVGGMLVDFTAKEFWLENYATAGKDSTAPNAMWKRRPYAQLAKCAEAQALRKAFPELGAAPTADEMEGKMFEGSGEVTDGATGEVLNKKPTELPAYSDADLDKNMPAWQKAINTDKATPQAIVNKLSTKFKMSDDQTKIIMGMVKEQPKEEKRDPVTIDNDAPAIDPTDTPF